MAEPDYDRIAAEVKWLNDNPHFEQRPATMLEFFGADYLNIERKVRPGLKAALVDIFGDEVSGDILSRVRYAMVTGAIGIGKTTFASIALPYMAHWVLCLKNPQDYFNLLDGSRIAFMQMSTSEKQALEVVFGDIFARIKHSPWFIQNAPYDDKYSKQIRFPKDIWIIPGDSSETTFEGYNILGGILDEMDSHKVTKEKDYADVGFDTINSRIESRFGNKGLIILIGQMKKNSGFAARKYNELKGDPEATVIRQSIWESLGWDRFLDADGERDSFFYDTKRKAIVTKELAELVDHPEHLIEVPRVYIKSFQNNPEKALRDLAGIPPAVSDPFISLVDRIEEARDRWKDRFSGVDGESPVDDRTTRPKFRPWFTNVDRYDPRKRAAHIDIAISGDGDACGIAMGYVDSIVEIDEEKKPYIVFDFLMRIHAMPGTEIMLSEVRQIIYTLRDELRFRLKTVTLDGFQSTDTMQQLRKKKFHVDYLSVDKNTLPYEDLREAIYERRVEFPEYVTYLNAGDDRRVEIAVKELMELSHDGKKVDHPEGGSKDVADAMAGVVSTLMGDRQYRKGVTSIGNPANRQDSLQEVGLESLSAPLPAGLRAPVPPMSGSGSFGLAVPSRLKPRSEW
jgi:hypothetical protein